jgi:hypothetical protein
MSIKNPEQVLIEVNIALKDIEGKNLLKKQYIQGSEELKQITNKIDGVLRASCDDYEKRIKQLHNAYSSSNKQQTYIWDVETARNYLLSLQSELNFIISPENGAVVATNKYFKTIDHILDLLQRFHFGAYWLEKHRRKNHVPFVINDEFDVQDLLYSFLVVNFPDAEVEDPAKKIAGVSSRLDVVIGNLKLIIEIKCFKKENNWTTMFKDINHKIQTYSQNEEYDQMIIFIYNPDSALKSPYKIEKDITKEQTIDGKKFQVIGIIDPK